MKSHTYDEWKELGFYVKKGQKCSNWTDDGRALFLVTQVAPLQSKVAPWYEDEDYEELPADAPNQ